MVDLARDEDVTFVAIADDLYDGDWHDGDWHDGDWHDADWHDADWHDADWKDFSTGLFFAEQTRRLGRPGDPGASADLAPGHCFPQRTQRSPGVLPADEVETTRRGALARDSMRVSPPGRA